MIAFCSRHLFDRCLGSVALDPDQTITLLNGTVIPVAPEPEPETGRVDWIEDPEDDGLICRVCATQAELDRADNDLARIELSLAADYLSDQ